MSYWEDIPDDVFFAIPLHRKGKTFYGSYVQQKILSYVQRKRARRENKRHRRLKWIELNVMRLNRVFRNTENNFDGYYHFFMECLQTIRSLKIKFENFREYRPDKLRYLKTRPRYKNLTYNEFIAVRRELLRKAMNIKLGKEYVRWTNPIFFNKFY